MADNLTVLNSTGGTFTIRMTDVGAGILANNSIPTSTSGSPMSVQAGAAVVSTAQGAAVVVISSLSPTHTVTLSSNPTVIPSSAVQVTLTSNIVALSSNPTITSVSSGAVSLISGANTANIVAGSSAVTSTMSALVVALSTLGNFSITTSSLVQVSNGTNTANVVAGSSAVTSTMAALVVAISTLGNAGLSVTTISSGSFAIINGANTAAVLAGSSTVTSTMASLVVSMSSNGAGIIGTGVFGTTASSQVLSIQGSSAGTPVATIYSTTGLGGTTSSLSAPVVPADQYGQYTVVGSSLTQQSLGSSAGRVGDYLAYLTVFPQIAASGAVTVFDSTTTTIGGYVGGGTTALPSLVPFRIDIGAYSVSSGWKVTTSSNISAVAIGKFT